MNQLPFLFMFDSPIQIIFVIAVILLLFGSTRLPQLAKSIGQSQKAFKDGLREGAEDEKLERQKSAELQSPPLVSDVSDEELSAEMRRRAETKQ